MLRDQEGTGMCLLQGVKAHMYHGWRAYPVSAHPWHIQEYKSSGWTSATFATVSSYQYEDGNAGGQ